MWRGRAGFIICFVKFNVFSPIKADYSYDLCSPDAGKSLMLTFLLVKWWLIYKKREFEYLTAPGQSRSHTTVIDLMPRYFFSISPGFVEEHFSQKNTKCAIVRRKTHFKHFDRILGKVQATLFKCSLSICTCQHCHYPATTAGVSFVSNPSNRSRQVAKPSLAIDQVPALPGVAPPPLSSSSLYPPH